MIRHIFRGKTVKFDGNRMGVPGLECQGKTPPQS
jgi:hypothetical protein